MATNISRRNVISRLLHFTRFAIQKTPLMKTICDEFENYVPKVIEKGVAEATLIGSRQLRDRIQRLSNYYMWPRYPIQGEFIAFTYEALEKPDKISDELLNQFFVLVTAVELVQTYLFFTDDIDEDGTLRCGKTCWHLLPDVGSMALNDMTMLRSFIDELIRQNFKGELSDKILNIFTKIYLTGSMAQHIEIVLSKSRNYSQYNIETYNATNVMKSFYAVKSPILLALALSNKLNKETYQHVDNVCTDIGTLVQIHNDIIEAVASEKGKSESDIQNANCTWVAVALLERCNAQQRRVFEECYGTSDPENINRIKQLYKEMDIVQLYQQEEQARYDAYLQKVNELPANSVPSADFFRRLADLMRSYSGDVTKYMY